jgi:hypothetical protein
MVPTDIHRRRRVRFDRVEHYRFPDGRARIMVHLEWEGQMHVGTAIGVDTLEGGLRSCAQATLEAALRATGHPLRLNLGGIKAVRAFDAWIVICVIRGESESRSYQLLGSCAAPGEDTVRGAAISVLDALNRVLEKYVAPTEEAESA